MGIKQVNAGPKNRELADGADVDRVNLGRLGGFVGFRLRRIQNLLSRKFSDATASLGMRNGLFSSLAIIQANPGISQNLLAQEVGLDKSLIVTIVDDLEAFGWAKRKRSEEDRRRHALFVTPAGQSRLDELFAIMTEAESAVLHQLSAGEMHLLSELLDRMYDAVIHDEA